MDESEQQRRRRTPLDQASGLASRLVFFIVRPAIPSVISGLGLPILIVFCVILLFVFLITLTGGGLGPGGIGPGGSPSPTPAPIPPGGGTVYIAQCTFYYGDGKPVRIVNPSLAAFVEGVAKKTDVPASVIMAILARESSFLVGGGRAPNGECDFDTDLCNVRSVENAIGAMQTIPSTFKNTAGHYAREIKDNFNKEFDRDTSSNPNQNPGPATLWIASYKDSITVGVYEIKRLKRAAGESLPWNEETVRKVAQGYQGGEKSSESVGCSKGYCNDVWKSVQECESKPVIAGIDQVIQLVDRIKSVCPHSITGDPGGNVQSCLSNVPTTLNRLSEVKAEMQYSADRSRNRVLECVGFVQSLIPLLDYPDIGRQGFAYEYGNPPYPNRYNVVDYTKERVLPGDIAVWKPGVGGSGNSGHIAFVLELETTNTVKIAEANWCTPACGRIDNSRSVPLSLGPTILRKQ